MVKKANQITPIINIKLNWDIPDHREVWKAHLRLSGLLGFWEWFTEHAEIPDMFKKMIGSFLEPLVQAIHDQVWVDTYKAFPELEEADVEVDFDEGVIRNSLHEEDDKNNNTTH